MEVELKTMKEPMLFTTALSSVKALDAECVQTTVLRAYEFIASTIHIH